MATRVVRRTGRRVAKRVAARRNSPKPKASNSTTTRVREALTQMGRETRAAVDRAGKQLQAGAKKAIGKLKRSKKAQAAVATAAGLAVVTAGVVRSRLKHK